MSEKFSGFAGGVASGTDKTIWNLFNPAATPTRRAAIYYFNLGSDDTPADQACRFLLGRTTAVGTEGSGYTPVNSDIAGPAGELDLGCGAFSAEPTYTASKTLWAQSANQRASIQWYAQPGCEFLVPATQNAGIGLKSSASTSTQAYESAVLFQE